MWLKVERLASIQEAVVNEMQNNSKEFLGEGDVEEDWLSASPSDMRRPTVGSSPSSAGSESDICPFRNSGTMAEEEPSTWLRDYGV